ncbi:receptor-like protein EIX1 [Argentina anserina]|uniref:receptor-like protein EIX1 n=1 Tax=Argentina anserina TaxID=57926 RepID=UPI0021763EF4|nr:receptor-like protein EIX1 [Potentilla anserina]
MVSRSCSSRSVSCHLVSTVLLLLLTKCSILLDANSDGNSFKPACIELERKALLKFKQVLKVPLHKLSSWVGEDCCSWLGVGCSNQTGNVVKLDLRCDVQGMTPFTWACIGGELDSSLLNLTHLNYLDMSSNNFSGTSIPSFIGSLKKLRHLDLSDSSFGGMVPPHLGNLSNLVHLSLASDALSAETSLWVSDLNWISRLSSLQYLSLAYVNLSKASADWLSDVNKLPSLLELDLTNSQLHHLPQYLPHVNFTSLSVIELSYNHFNSSSPHWLFNISTLVTVRIDGCSLTGSIPESAWKQNHCSLQTLDLSYNSLSMDVQPFIAALSTCSNSSLRVLDIMSNNLHGSLPESLGSLKYLETFSSGRNSISGLLPATIGNLSTLQVLNLDFNNLMNGTIPESLGQLSGLYVLSLWGGSWEGVFTETHLQNLSSLKFFSLSSTNSLVFDVSPHWTPPFNLFSLSISDCKLMSLSFPAWLRNQSDLTEINFSNVGISDGIPDWFWTNPKGNFMWSFVDLSDNKLRGQLPSSVNFYPGAYVDLENNFLEGSLPLWQNVMELSLANNRFSGPIPTSIGEQTPNLWSLDLSKNNLNGSIPASLGKAKNLYWLDLSRNHLSGTIPRLVMTETIDFSYNNLSGHIPHFMCSQLSLVSWLRLSNNNLSGEIDKSFQNCTRLVTLDLGGNKLSGSIPEWIGGDLYVLMLGNNRFTGSIPQQICNLPYLHVLNLSQNHLSGFIPLCLGSLERMKQLTIRFDDSYVPSGTDIPLRDLERVDLNVKGVAGYEYGRSLLDLVNSIDLSSNNLGGEIPEEITSLSYLGSLNLSRNQLTGSIPAGIGKLGQLETLDLSSNHLRGSIPLSMTSMTSLSKLNLSHNNLSGPIPSANQFQTFNDPAMYEGNSGLCGAPLPTQCSASDHDDPGSTKEHDDGSGDRGLYISITLGFIIGFWGVFGSLVIKRSWRHAYFSFS